ncbi:hypothetical protein LzC2_41380 [Planctomycetes bacterium LzC2]|uniref:Uncharacterized protein n=1 Tax=Alienimonas chondri TaxID=2681879 RepID=A0ABX1VJU9_9PLAN|nr:hypothetical protein [Alienimonas chondri]
MVGAASGHLELRFVAAGGRLAGLHGAAAEGGVDHGQFGGRVVPPAAGGVGGVERHPHAVAVAGEVHRRPRAAALPHRVAEDLRPKGTKALPGEPLRGPARAGVAGEGDGPTQPVAPPGQQRVASFGAEDHLRGRLRTGDDVAQQEGGVLHPHAVQHRGRAEQLRDERFLVDGRFRGGDGLLGEDLGDVAGVVGEVVPTAAGAGDLFEEVHVGALPDADRGDGDAVAGEVAGDAVEVAGGALAVGQDDDVLELRGGPAEGVAGLGHRGIQRGAAAGADGGDARFQPGLVAGGANVGDPGRGAVEGDHAQLVLRAEQFDRGLGGVLGQLNLLAAHRAGFVDDQHHRQRGLLLLLFEVGADRQHLLQHAAVVAAEAEGLVPAQHHQPAAEVADVGPHDGHLTAGQVRRGDVGEDDDLVVLQVGHVLRHAAGGTHVGLHVLFFERPDEAAGGVGVGIDQQNARLAGGVDEAGRGVVVDQRVLLRPADADGVLREAVALDGLAKAEAVLAGLQRLLLGDHFERAAEDLDGDFVVVVGIDGDLHEERLPAGDLRGDEHLGDGDLRLGPRGQGDDVDAVERPQRRLHGVPGGFVAVGQQHDAAHLVRRRRGERRAERRGDVRAPQSLLGGLRFAVAARRRAPRFGSRFQKRRQRHRRAHVRGEGQHDGFVPRGQFAQRGEVLADGVPPLLPPHRQRFVRDEHDVPLRRRPQQREAAEGQHQQHDHHRPHRQRGDPLAAVEVNQAPPVQVPERREQQQPQQPPRPQQIEGVPGQVRGVAGHQSRWDGGTKRAADGLILDGSPLPPGRGAGGEGAPRAIRSRPIRADRSPSPPTPLPKGEGRS